MDLFDVFESDNLETASDQKKRKLDSEDNHECDDLINSVIGGQTDATESKKIRSADDDEVIIEDNATSDDIEIIEEKIEPLVAKTICHELECRESCVHEVVIPVDLEYVALRESQSDDYKPAKEYDFTLDPFQKEAILCIENNQSVLGIDSFSLIGILILVLKFLRTHRPERQLWPNMQSLCL